MTGAVDDPKSDAAAFDRQHAINLDAAVTAIRSASKPMGDGASFVTGTVLTVDGGFGA